MNSGHKEVGFLGGQKGIVFTQRLKGYKKALKAKGLVFSDDLVFNANPSRVGGYEAMNELLQKKPRLKAAVCYNDVAAFGALSALGEKGLLAGADFGNSSVTTVLDGSGNQMLMASRRS